MISAAATIPQCGYDTHRNLHYWKTHLSDAGVYLPKYALLHIEFSQWQYIRYNVMVFPIAFLCDLLSAQEIGK